MNIIGYKYQICLCLGQCPLLWTYWFHHNRDVFVYCVQVALLNIVLQDQWKQAKEANAKESAKNTKEAHDYGTNHPSQYNIIYHQHPSSSFIIIIIYTSHHHLSSSIIIIHQHPSSSTSIFIIHHNPLWYPMSIYVSKGRYNSFYRLALYNLVLGLTDILLKSKLFKWWMSYMVTWHYMVMPPS